MLPAEMAYNPNSLLLYFFETIRGAATKVPKNTLVIWISSKIVILINTRDCAYEYKYRSIMNIFFIK